MLRRLTRIVLSVPAILVGAALIRLAVLLDQARGRHAVAGLGYRTYAGWCRFFCRLHGIRLNITGERLVGAPALIVANHVSWLDILCLSAEFPVAFLSKSEVKRWPIVGRIATALGTMYIDRGQRRAADRALEQMRSRLEDGYRVLFFPEGTTSDGSDVLPFRPRLYQAAIDAGAPVQPVTISYLHPDGRRCSEAAFVGDEPLIANLWRVARMPSIEARLVVGEPVADAPGRSALAARSREIIRQGLPEPA